VVSGLAHPDGNITGFANYEYSFGASGLRAHSNDPPGGTRHGDPEYQIKHLNEGAGGC
jgi:hypothetical protein